MMIYSMVFGGLSALLSPAFSRAILSAYGIGLSTSGLAVGLLLIFYIVILAAVCVKKRKSFYQKMDS